jgi:hypothetical protein
VKFERTGRDRKQVSVYPFEVADAAAKAEEVAVAD